MFAGLYSFDVPELPFEPRSVIIAATPHYSYSEVTFHHEGRVYPLYAALIFGYDTADVDAFVAGEIANRGYHSAPVEKFLPLKLFGARSGLAAYGRNNITYIDGLGSYFGYAAYFSDLPPESDVWVENTVSPTCDGCRVCFNHCPTGAIQGERFLLDSSRCFSGLTTRPGEFPDFVPRTAHHTISRCMRCQYSCPMNREANARVLPPVDFDEAETAHILSGAPYDDAPEVLKRKAEIFGLGMYPAIPRNLLACFDLIDSGTACSLE
jgi:epoxyqueuosine reductase